MSSRARVFNEYLVDENESNKLSLVSVNRDIWFSRNKIFMHSQIKLKCKHRLVLKLESFGEKMSFGA